MAKADIILEEDRINVVGGDGPEEVDGVERGDLEITTGKDQVPGVRLNADRANLTLGGGDASGSEGDVKLFDREGNNRVTLTAEGDNNSPTDGKRAWIDGGRGRLELGENVAQDDHTPLIWLDGPDGELGIADEGTPWNKPVISLNAALDDDRYQSEFRMDDGDEYGGIRLRTTAWEVPGYPAGEIAVFDSDANKGIELHGESATLRLGYSYMEGGEVRDAGPEAGGDIWIPPRGVGRSGQIILDDGDASLIGQSTMFGIRASEGRLEVTDMADTNPQLTLDPTGESATLRLGYSDHKTGKFRGDLGEYVSQSGEIVLHGDDFSTVFGVRASEGRFEVAEMGDTNPRLTLEPTGRLEVLDGDRNAVFTVDPDDKVVKIPESWKIESGSDTVLE
jgi:hypothetical protein